MLLSSADDVDDDDDKVFVRTIADGIGFRGSYNIKMSMRSNSVTVFFDGRVLGGGIVE